MQFGVDSDGEESDMDDDDQPHQIELCSYLEYWVAKKKAFGSSHPPPPSPAFPQFPGTCSSVPSKSRVLKGGC